MPKQEKGYILNLLFAVTYKHPELCLLASAGIKDPYAAYAAWQMMLKYGAARPSDLRMTEPSAYPVPATSHFPKYRYANQLPSGVPVFPIARRKDWSLHLVLCSPRASVQYAGDGAMHTCDSDLQLQGSCTLLS